jgi:hypothetical protein
VARTSESKPRRVHSPGLALARLLPVNADCEIEVDVFVRDKAVLTVLGKAGVAGGRSVRYSLCRTTSPMAFAVYTYDKLPRINPKIGPNCGQSRAAQ